MALNAYLKLTGKKQGWIKGSAKQKGQEDKIIVIAAGHEIISPRDAASGLPTGKRQHKPFVITKELDKSTPILYTVLCTNEVISEFVLQFWKPSTGSSAGLGVETQYYTVRLTNASICDIKFNMLNNKNPDLQRYAEYEEIAFMYEKIEWTWNDGGITSMDELKMI